MATRNDITGDNLTSKSPSKAYDDGWDRIFGKKKKELKPYSNDGNSAEHVEERANWYGNYKHKQQDLTELNSDGNRERGRYGEDLKKEK